MKVLKLGTRKSLLAWAQSSQVARSVEAASRASSDLEPVSVELVGIETRGDRIQDVPLSQVDGKEFFVKELDDALLDGRVDLTVHSLKDLSLDRPKGTFLGAIPKREDPRDVIVFHEGVIDRIRRGEPVRIGTSAPRRLENLPDFLKRALPSFGTPASIKFVEIRGNVNTRLSRIHEAEGSPRKLDGAVLALAGLQRLYLDAQARPTLEGLFQNARLMVLPLRECPTSPGQAALAVECRSGDADTALLLRRIHDARTETAISDERRVLREWGGGCHLSLGATFVDHPVLGSLFSVRGRRPTGERIEEFHWSAPVVREAAQWEPSDAWSAPEDRADESLMRLPTPELTESRLSGAFVFVAHFNAVSEQVAPALKDARVWCSGTTSWERLARMGVWVEGCAESLGYEFIERTVALPVLRLGGFERAIVLTHDLAASTWPVGQVVATYRSSTSALPQEDLSRKKAFYWGSSQQYLKYKDQVRADAWHFCGPGKTRAFLIAQGLEARTCAFPSREEWKRWLAKNMGSR